MIRNDLTKEKYGYVFSDLGKYSRNFLIFQCDSCGEIIEKIRKNFRKWFTLEDKAFCTKCMAAAREYGIAKKYTSYEEYLNTRHQNLKKNNLAKYGVENVSQLSEIKEKKVNTFLKNYNHTSYIQSEEGKKHREARLLEVYGVKNCSQSDVIKDKKEKTFLNRYNVKNIFQDEAIKQNIQKYFLDNYNVVNPSQIPEVQNKKEISCLKSTGYKHNFINPVIREKSRKGCLATGRWKFPEEGYVKKIAEEKGISTETFYSFVRRFGVEQFEESFRLRMTKIEFVVKQFLESLKMPYIFNKRITTDCNPNKNKKFSRPDFIVPSNRVIIECDGLFWHCDKFRDKDYHVDRRKYFVDNNYFPLFFREHEILHHQKIVESIIKNRLNLITNRIFARKTTLKVVEFEEAKLFFTNNHLMGKGLGETLGLYSNDRLVLAMQYRWKNKQDRLLEISRLCPLIDHSIIGGYSKLLKFLIKLEHPKQVVNFIDKRYGDGNYLSQFGFVKESEFISFQWTDFIHTFHRMKYPSNSGYDNGLYKIWDCGQAKYVLTL